MKLNECSHHCSDHNDDLPHHVAKKKVPYINDAGERFVQFINDDEFLQHFATSMN